MAQVLRDRPPIPWFELLADNYLALGYARRVGMEKVREAYPMTLHCVGMDLGGSDELDFVYLGGVRTLMRVLEPAWVSDHLCFTRLDGRHYHDLLPLPYTEEALLQVSERVLRVQDFLGCRIAVENVSSYVHYRASTIDEAQFLSELSARTECGLLVDVNNAFVSAANHGSDAETFLWQLPSENVWEVHLGGYAEHGELLVDAHNRAVSAPVWRLYEQFMTRVPDAPTLIEWDNNIPELSVLQTEAARAQVISAAHVRVGNDPD